MIKNLKPYCNTVKQIDMRANNELERYWIVLGNHYESGKIVKDFETLEECREFLKAGLKGYRKIEDNEVDYNKYAIWFDIVDGDNENVVLDTSKDNLKLAYVEEGGDTGLVESTDTYYTGEAEFMYIEGEYTDRDITFQCENNKKYNIVFNDDTDSNDLGFKSAYKDCLNYILMNNGTSDSYFGDYKGGTVCIVDTETGEEVYSESVK